MFGPSPYALPLSSAKSPAGRPPIVRAVRSSDGGLAAGELRSRLANTQELHFIAVPNPGAPAVSAEQQSHRQHGIFAVANGVPDLPGVAVHVYVYGDSADLFLQRLGDLAKCTGHSWTSADLTSSLVLQSQAGYVDFVAGLLHVLQMLAGNVDWPSSAFHRVVC